MRFDLATLRGSDVTPSYEDATVGDAMHPGLLACEPDDSLIDVARLMADYHVHCVALLTGDPRELHGVISGRDLLRAATAEPDRTAVAIASSAFIRARPEDPLAVAVERMVAAGVDHAIVMRHSSPVGVLSSADVAAIIAWGRA